MTELGKLLGELEGPRHDAQFDRCQELSGASPALQHVDRSLYCKKRYRELSCHTA